MNIQPNIKGRSRAPLFSRSRLYGWQASVARQIVEGPILVAAQPGSGKTITLLTAAADGIDGGTFRRILLVAPRLILDSVWPAEAGAWEHTSTLSFDLAHNYGSADRERLWFAGSANIVTVTPDLLPRFVEAVIARGTLPVDAVFVDESQLFKNPAATRTRALLGLAASVTKIALASGTPTPNGPIDGWVPGRLGSPDNRFFDSSFQRWRARHFIQGTRSFIWRPRPGTEARVAGELAKRGIAMHLRDTADVPNELYLTHRFEFEPEHQALIRAFVRDRTVVINGESYDAGEGDGGYLVRLHQLSQGHARIGEPPRIAMLSKARAAALREVVESVDGPVLVATRFKADILAIRGEFPDVVTCEGETPIARRHEILDQWNRDKIPLLAANATSLGHGVNLQQGSCRALVWYAQSWSWELFCQFNARLVRSGQNKRVSIVSLYSDVGLDRAITQVLANKQSGEAALLAALKR